MASVFHAFTVEGDIDVSDIASNTFDMERPPKSRCLQTFPAVDSGNGSIRGLERKNPRHSTTPSRSACGTCWIMEETPTAQRAETRLAAAEAIMDDGRASDTAPIVRIANWFWDFKGGRSMTLGFPSPISLRSGAFRCIDALAP